MAYSFAPWVDGEISGVARFEATYVPDGDSGPVPRPMDDVLDAVFLGAVRAAFETVCEHYPILGRACVLWDIQRFPVGLLSVGGDSIYGVAVLVFAKVVAEFFPDAANRDIRGLRVDRIGITASPGDKGCFGSVGGGSLRRKLEALAVLQPISIAVIPRGQPGAPTKNGSEVHEFEGPLGLKLPWVEGHDPWECIENLYLLQARSILV